MGDLFPTNRCNCCCGNPQESSYRGGPAECWLGWWMLCRKGSLTFGLGDTRCSVVRVVSGHDDIDRCSGVGVEEPVVVCHDESKASSDTLDPTRHTTNDFRPPKTHPPPSRPRQPHAAVGKRGKELRKQMSARRHRPRLAFQSRLPSGKDGIQQARTQAGRVEQTHENIHMVFSLVGQRERASKRSIASREVGRLATKYVSRSDFRPDQLSNSRNCDRTRGNIPSFFLPEQSFKPQKALKNEKKKILSRQLRHESPTPYLENNFSQAIPCPFPPRHDTNNNNRATAYYR